MESYVLLKEPVTAERVKAWFREIVQGEVVRYELPKIGALNFVLPLRCSRRWRDAFILPSPAALATGYLPALAIFHLKIGRSLTQFTRWAKSHVCEIRSKQERISPSSIHCARSFLHKAMKHASMASAVERAVRNPDEFGSAVVSATGSRASR